MHPWKMEVGKPYFQGYVKKLPMRADAKESDEVNGAQRLQPESAKLHLSAHSVTDANLAQDKLEKMVGIINVMMFKSLGDRYICCDFLNFFLRVEPMNPAPVSQESTLCRAPSHVCREGGEKPPSDPPDHLKNDWVVATQLCVIFTPKIGEMIQFDEHIFRWIGSTTN